MVQVEVSVDSGEAFDRALARFKKMCGKAGIVTEIKKRSFYEKPSEKRRRIEMKRQRKVKPRRMGERPFYSGGNNSSGDGGSSTRNSGGGGSGTRNSGGGGSGTRNSGGGSSTR